MSKFKSSNFFCPASCLQEEEFQWERAMHTEPQEPLALKVNAVTSAWAKLDDLTWKDRVSLAANPAQHQDTAQGKRRLPYHPVHCVIYRITGSSPLPNGKVMGDVSDTRDSPTGTI